MTELLARPKTKALLLLLRNRQYFMENYVFKFGETAH